MFNVVIVAGIVITVLTGIPVFLQLSQHPRGLAVLFFAEMWERFSYYGMRGLLIFYLTEHFLFDDTFANGQYAAYTTLVYLLPLVGRLRRRPLARQPQGDRVRRAAAGRRPLHHGDRGAGGEGDADLPGPRLQLPAGRPDGRPHRLPAGRGRLLRVGAAPGGGLAIKGLPAARAAAARAGQGQLHREPVPLAAVRRRALPGAGADHHGRRLPEGQHLLDRRPALSAGRPAPRSRLHALLLRHQPRRVLGRDRLRPARPDRELGRRASASPASACWPASWCS